MDNKKKQCFKHTLSLPKTNFPMKPNGENLVSLQKKILEYWNKIDIYKKTRKNKETKYLHFGPPYANNNLHVGHSATMILKDIVVRWWNTNGYNSETRPGFDCHGLPIEINVQKQQKEQLSVTEFRKACRKEAEFWLKKQKATMNDLGLLINPEHYTTMENTAGIYSVFSRILLSNKVFCAHKILPWSIVEKTVISDAEIEYRDKTSLAVYVKLPLKNDPNTHLVIWTTTPWSLIDNTAVAINLNYEYIKVQYNHSNIIIVKDNYEKFSNLLNMQLKIIESIDPKDLTQLSCKHPLKNHYVPIVHSDHVNHEDGTGIVHIAPAHGLDDFALYEKGLVDIVDEISDSGHFETDIKKLNGLHIFDNSLEVIIDILGDNLIYSEKIQHRYPFASRSLKKDVPLIFKATKQIFFDIKHIRNKELLYEKLDKSTLFPNTLKDSLITLISTRSEWCVSRQRYWGVPLCIFLHKKTHEVLVNEKLQNKILAQVNKDPDFFFHEDCINILDGIVNKDDYYPYIGVLDVWFDSGCSFYFVTNQMENLPVAQVYLEGKDQIRGWFQSSLLTNLLFNNKIPYKDVVSHGFLVDEKGYKISKSLGNGVPLDNIINEYGIEILRLWVMYIDFSAATMKIGHNLFNDIRQKYRKIRNVMRYLLSIVEQTPQDHILNVNDTIDLAMLEQLRIIYQEYTMLMNQYEFNKAFTKLFNYINYISSFYFNVKKDILYCDSNDSTRKQSAQKTCKIIFISLMILLAPVLPFTMEELFLHCKLFQDQSVHILETDIIDNLLINYQDNSNMILLDNINNDLKDIRVEIEKMIQDKHINSSIQAQVHCNFNYDLDLLKEVAMVSEVIESDTNFVLKINNKQSCLRCHYYCDQEICERCAGIVKI